MPLTVATIVRALEELGGEAHLSDITDKVSQIADGPLPISFADNIRGRLQDHCEEGKSYLGGKVLFYSVHGLQSRRGEWGLVNYRAAVAAAEKNFEETAYEEGGLKLATHLKRERSRLLVERFKDALDSFECRVCNFDFGKAYGDFAVGFIEAHHTKPLGDLAAPGVSKISDLVGVCANCHRALHLDPDLTWQELKVRFQALS